MMNSAATSTRNLKITGMSGDKCVAEVRSALKAVPNISTKSVEVGAATIDADSAGCSAACSALGAAGYQSRESHSEGQGSERPADGSGKSQTGRMGDAAMGQAHRQSGDAADHRREDTLPGSGRPNAPQRG